MRSQAELLIQFEHICLQLMDTLATVRIYEVLVEQLAVMGLAKPAIPDAHGWNHLGDDVNH